MRLFRKNRKEERQRVSPPHAEYSTAERPFALDALNIHQQKQVFADGSGGGKAFAKD
jgi:hypothetical protein